MIVEVDDLLSVGTPQHYEKIRGSNLASSNFWMRRRKEQPSTDGG